MGEASALEAIDVAVFAALNAGVTGAGVHQHVPQDAALPLVAIGDLDGAMKLGGKGARAARGVPMTIVVVTEGEERAPCSQLLGQAERILDGATLHARGYTISPVFERASSVLHEDGGGYVGLAQFNVLAIPH